MTTKVAIKSAIWMYKEDPAPIYRGKRKAGGEQELVEARDRHHALCCSSFFNAHRLWPIAFLNLEAVGETRLSKCDSPAGVGVL